MAPASATAGELRSFLAKFLFSGDDVYKHVRDLSGGEKGRLALAKLIYSRVNVLVLDEPTNHLDIPSREALEEALDAYEGTIITISHDRYFLDRVATQILALDGSGRAEHYDGDYTDYHDWKAARGGSSVQDKIVKPENLVDTTSSRAVDLERKKPDFVASPGGVQATTKRSGKKGQAAGQSKTAGVKVIKKRKAEVKTPELIEAEIAQAEKRLSEISEQMGLPEMARDSGRLIALSEEYQRTEYRASRVVNHRMSGSIWCGAANA